MHGLRPFTTLFKKIMKTGELSIISSPSILHICRFANEWLPSHPHCHFHEAPPTEMGPPTYFFLLDTL